MIVVLFNHYYEKNTPTFFKIKKATQFRIKNSD
jgi:hypothetical protein